MSSGNPASGALDPITPLQRWIKFTEEELRSLRFDFQGHVQVTYGEKVTLTNQVRDFQHHVANLQENIREVNESITELHQNVRRIRSLISELWRDLSTSSPSVVAPDSLATLLLE